MGHPQLENATGFAVEPLLLADRDGRPLLVPLIKGTYEIAPGAPLRLAEEQVPVNPEGEFWGEPGASSYRYEPETAFTKPLIDFVVIGHAYAQVRGTTELSVELKVGGVSKAVKVLGDRFWVKALGAITMTRPLPFERIPLTYENAYGGREENPSDSEKPSCERRNPLGKGFVGKNEKWKEQRALPNLENPRTPIRRITDSPQPAGLGFISPDWEPRASFAGTYDDAWKKGRMPLLPTDFDPRFFNAAHPDLVMPSGALRGDEPVLILNTCPGGRISFNLPGRRLPRVRVALRKKDDLLAETLLDTIIVDTDRNRLFLLWRCAVPLNGGPHDLISLRVGMEN